MIDSGADPLCINRLFTPYFPRMVGKDLAAGQLEDFHAGGFND